VVAAQQRLIARLVCRESQLSVEVVPGCSQAISCQLSLIADELCFAEERCRHICLAVRWIEHTGGAHILIV